MVLKWFEMDETELICVGVIPEHGDHLVVIDFLPTPPNKKLRRTASSGSFSRGDATAWQFTLAKEINETLNSCNDV
jgi:hypothetical protein